MGLCPCGSSKEYAQCCRPLIKGEEQAATAEALMRSRYSAHVNVEVDYIHDTTHPDKREGYNRQAVAAWCKRSEWQALEVVGVTDGGEDDQTGTVEFIARYREKGKLVKHHEIAEFARKDDRWYFVDGQAPKQEQIVRQGPKVGRNDPCPCGSGKKYKKCCGA